MTTLRQGDLFAGKYKLLKHHDTGGFASIWKASQIINQEIVALKIFPMLKEEAREQIALEDMEKARQLQHERLIVPVHIEVSEDGLLALKMRFCGGGNASDLEGQMTERQAALFLEHIGRALAYLHDKGFIHGDVKPNNVLLGPILYREQADTQVDTGQAEDFYLCDLSLSQKTQQTIRRTLNMHSDEGATDIKKESGLGRTPTCYRAPELYPKYQPVKASDIWALGASLHEILAGGKLPFDDMGGLNQKDDRSIPSLPADLRASPDLDLIIRSCLRKNAWDRPLAKQLAEYGKSFLETGQWLAPEERQKLLRGFDGPIIESPPPPPPPPGDTKRPWLKIVLFILLLTGLGGGGYGLHEYIVRKQIAELLKNAETLLVGGKCDSAIVMYKKVLEHRPEDSLAKDGILNAEKGKQSGKCNSAEETQQIAKLLQEGKALYEQGRCDEAIAKYDEVLRLKPGYGSAEDGRIKAMGAKQSGKCGGRRINDQEEATGDRGDKKPAEERDPSASNASASSRIPSVSSSACDTGEPSGGQITKVIPRPEQNVTEVHYTIESNGKINLYPPGHKNAFRMVFGGKRSALSGVKGPTGEGLEVPSGGLQVVLMFDQAISPSTTEIKLFEAGTGSGNWCNQAILTWSKRR